MNKTKPYHLLSVIKLAPQKIGGFENWLIDITGALVAAGQRHTICFEDEPASFVRERLEQAGATVIVQSFDVASLRQMSQMRRMLRDTGADLVHMHFYAQMIGPISLQLHLSKVPLILTYHISGLPSSAGYLKRLLKKARYAVLGRSIKNIICVSKSCRRKLLEDYQLPSSITTVVYNGVSPNQYAGTQTEKNHPTIIIAAHLIPEKGVHHAISAMPDVVAAVPDARLRIAGEGEQKPELESLAKSFGVEHSVEFLGLRSDVPQLFATSDVVLVPSVWSEAFAYVVIEGMASGTPVAASRLGGNTEAIEHEVTGLLFEPENVAQIGGSIIRLLQDKALARKFGAAAVERTNTVFNQHQSLDNHLVVYSEALGNAK